MTEKIKKFILPLAIIIAGLAISGTLLYVKTGKLKEVPQIPQGLTAQEVADKTINFINKNMLEAGIAASLINVIEENGLYKLHFKIVNDEYDSYVTKDGKLLFVQPGVDLDSNPAANQEGNQTTQEIPKKDIPEVKIFVMSLCPYGLQAEKMFLPVYDLLKDKTEMGIYFVDYIMHGKQEIDENLRQYCIEKDQKDRYFNYLSCFVKDGNYQKCLTEANIDSSTLNSRVSQTDNQYKITVNYNDKSTWLGGNYPKFAVQSDLNQKYSVQGSPTIIINDTEINLDQRSPEKFKEVICQAFNSQPSECNQTLSNEVPSSGLGEGTGSSASGGGCAQ